MRPSVVPLSLLALATTCLLTHCQSTNQKDPLLEEAARYHNEATEIQAVLEPKIEQIDSLKTVLATKRTPDNAARIATLDSLKTAFEEWEENLVEVPGMPHEHNHGKGEHKHKHADATLKDLPADQMHDLQRETLNNIRQIQARLEVTLKS